MSFMFMFGLCLIIAGSLLILVTVAMLIVLFWANREVLRVTDGEGTFVE